MSSKFYNIIPQAKLPRNINGIFTYKSDVELKSGNLVIIEFRKTDVLGLVINKVNQAGLPAAAAAQADKIKKVKKTAGAAPKFFVDLIQWLSDYYYASPAFIFDMITPRPPKRLTQALRELSSIGAKRRKSNLPFNASLAMTKNAFSDSLAHLGKNFKNLKVPESQIKYVKKISADQNGLINTFDLTVPAKFIVFYKLVEREIAQNRSVILLEPAIADLKITLSYMPRSWADKIILLYSDIYTAKNKYWQNWQKINESTKRKKPIIIIGARSAVWAPVNNLGLIIFDRAESDDYKQCDQNPRYDARSAALKINELTGCAVKMFSDGVVL